jgi:hypothetical protein
MCNKVTRDSFVSLRQIDFKDRKMAEVFLHASDGEHFFDKRSSGHDFGSFGSLPFIAFLGVNLSDPTPAYRSLAVPIKSSG